MAIEKKLPFHNLNKILFKIYVGGCEFSGALTPVGEILSDGIPSVFQVRLPKSPPIIWKTSISQWTSARYSWIIRFVPLGWLLRRAALRTVIVDERLLSPGDFIYIVNIVSAPRNPPQDLWYHCFYKSFEGYIPVSLIDIYGNWSTEKLDYLTTNKGKTFPERLAISKSVSAQSGNKIDSLNKRDETIKDSLYAVLDRERTKFVTELGVRAK
jgi:hypothetical protein